MKAKIKDMRWAKAYQTSGNKNRAGIVTLKLKIKDTFKAKSHNYSE